MKPKALKATAYYGSSGTVVLQYTYINQVKN